MKAFITSLKHCGSLILFAGFPISLLWLTGCSKETSKAIERTPTLSFEADSPIFQAYYDEFNKYLSNDTQASDLVLPFEKQRLPGDTLSVDHFPANQLWLILCRGGANWYENQLMFLYSEKTDSLTEVQCYRDKCVRDALLISGSGAQDVMILTSVRPIKSSYSEIWTNLVYSENMGRLTAGGECVAEPKHTKVAFWRTEDDGFHSLHIWDRGRNSIADVISVWESDPGSGISWQYGWSSDSKALVLKGNGGGFRRFHRRRVEFDLVYLIEEDRFGGRVNEN